MHPDSQVVYVGLKMRDWAMKHCKTRVFRAWQHAGLRESWKEGGQFCLWAWERSRVGKSEDMAVLCGASDVDHVEFDVWREIQEQVSNKLVWSSEMNPGMVPCTFTNLGFIASFYWTSVWFQKVVSFSHDILLKTQQLLTSCLTLPTLIQVVGKTERSCCEAAKIRFFLSVFGVRNVNLLILVTLCLWNW